MNAPVTDTRRVDVGDSHYYLLDGERVSSVSDILKRGLPKPALPSWAAGQVAEFAADRLHLLQQLQRDEVVDLLRGAPYRDRERAAVRGTEVHRSAERLLRGETLEVSGEQALLASQYARFLREWRVEAVELERPAFSRAHRYAGTFDLLARVRSQGRVLLDLKTNRSGPFPEVAIQLPPTATPSSTLTRPAARSRCPGPTATQCWRCGRTATSCARSMSGSRSGRPSWRPPGSAAGSTGAASRCSGRRWLRHPSGRGRCAMSSTHDGKDVQPGRASAPKRTAGSNHLAGCPAASRRWYWPRDAETMGCTCGWDEVERASRDLRQLRQIRDLLADDRAALQPDLKLNLAELLKAALEVREDAIDEGWAQARVEEQDAAEDRAEWAAYLAAQAPPGCIRMTLEGAASRTGNRAVYIVSRAGVAGGLGRRLTLEEFATGGELPSLLLLLLEDAEAAAAADRARAEEEPLA